VSHKLGNGDGGGDGGGGAAENGKKDIYIL